KNACDTELRRRRRFEVHRHHSTRGRHLHIQGVSKRPGGSRSLVSRQRLFKRELRRKARLPKLPRPYCGSIEIREYVGLGSSVEDTTKTCVKVVIVDAKFKRRIAGGVRYCILESSIVLVGKIS